jgi:hypothetical protein
MKIFNDEFTKDLLEIMRRLEHEKNINVRNVLLKDLKLILLYLGINIVEDPRNNKKILNNRIINVNELTNYIIKNQTNRIKIKEFKLFYVNHKKLSLLTKTFLERPNSKLSSTYKKMISYGGIKYFKEYSGYLGCTRYFKSLDKNYIEIYKKNLITDYSTKVHELSHARVNSICNNPPKQFYEVYPNFMELIFSDYLKENGFEKEAYNLKISFLNQIRNQLIELKYELHDYLNRPRKKSIDNFIFEYKYESSRDMILALYLYDRYLLNPENTLIKIDYFILNLNKLSEDELLSILDFDKNIFNNINKVFSKIYNKLEKERLMLLKK